MASRKIIEIDDEKCNGCGNCVTSCAEGAMEIRNGKAVIVKDSFCDGLGACIGDCPMDALHIIERDADDFDEVAVEKHLASKEKTLECGCPSTNVQEFCTVQPTGTGILRTATTTNQPSQLTNFPFQLKLVPPDAPFIKNADLAIIADCVAYAYASTHERFIKGKKLLIGCPKLDDKEYYVNKLADIIKSNDLKSITLV
ncbi:MAG: 4Fe-4S binding protein, partial [Thermoplasmata archaeon]|nr:4Fe-4S binding protein [Thermoplasmata archaeon]